MVLTLDSVTDGTRLLSAHPTKPIVAYEAETFVVLWDYAADKKYMLSGHTAPIGALSFTRDGLMVLSVEVGYQPKLILWRWRQLTAVSHAIAPTKNRRKSIKHISVDFSHDNELLVCVEGDINGRASLWTWQKGLVLLNTVSLENEAPVSSVLFLSDHTHFATIESTCVKFWAVNVDRTSLVSRVHVRRDILSGKLNPLSGLVFVLSQTGKVLVLNSQGQYVSSIHREGVTFTALLFFEDKLFLGTAAGSVQIYHSSTFAFQQEIPFSGPNRTNKSTVRQTAAQEAGFKIIQGPAVACLDISCDAMYLVVCHADRSFFVLSMEDNRQILCSAIGHSGRIQACEIGSKSSDWFISSASDSSVRLWNRSGDRWISKPLDILQSNAVVRSQSDLAHNTSHFATSPKPRESKTVSVTALAIHPRGSVVACGTSTGQLKLFDISANAVRSSLNLSESVCFALTFHISGRYVGCAQANGVVSLIDSSQGLKQIGMLEDKVNYAFHQAAESHKGVQFLKNVGSSILAASVNNFKDTTSSSSSSTDLGVITVTNPRMLRLQRIYNGSTGLHKTTLVQYPLESECVGFAIHPSDQYLLVTCRSGSIHLFHIETGELRGVIQAPELSFGCCVDPSGLYVIVCSPSDSQSSITLSNQASSKSNLIKQTAPYTDTHTDTHTDMDIHDAVTVTSQLGHRLCFYEIGTGRFAGSFDHLPPISCFSFSSDLSVFQASSDEGNIFIFTLADELRQNAEDALEVSRKQPDFWNAYPIHLNVKSQQKARTMSSPVRKPGHSNGLVNERFSKAVQSESRTRKSQPFSPLKAYDESSPEQIHRRSAPQLTRFSLDQPLRFEDYIDNETYGVEQRPIKSRNSNPMHSLQSNGGQRRGQSSGQRAFSRVVATDADQLDDDLDLNHNGIDYEDGVDNYNNGRFSSSAAAAVAANGIIDDDEYDENVRADDDVRGLPTAQHTNRTKQQQVLAKFTRGKPAAVAAVNTKGVSTKQMHQSHSMIPERDVPSKVQSRPASRLTADVEDEPYHGVSYTAEDEDDDSVYENERFKSEFLGVVEEARQSVTPIAAATSPLRGRGGVGGGVHARKSNDGGRSLNQKLAGVKIGSGKQIAPEPDDIDDDVDEHLHDDSQLQRKLKSTPTRVVNKPNIASGYVNDDLTVESSHQSRNSGGRWQNVVSLQRSQRQPNYSTIEDDNFNDNGPFEEPLTDRSHLVSEPDSIDNDYRSNRSQPKSIQPRSGPTLQKLQKGSQMGSHEHLLSREDLLALNVNRSLVRSDADGLLDRSTFETVEAKRLRNSRNGFAMDDELIDVELTSKQKSIHGNGVQHRQYASPNSNNRRPVGGVKDQIVFARRSIEKDTESVIEEVDSVFEELATFDSRLKTIQDQEAAKREQAAKMVQSAAKLTSKLAPSASSSKIAAK